MLIVSLGGVSLQSPVLFVGFERDVFVGQCDALCETSGLGAFPGLLKA